MNVSLTFSGSPGEIAKVMAAVQNATATTVIPKSLQPTGIDASTEFVSPELIQRALNRRKLTHLTRNLLRTLCDAEEDERFVRRSKLRLALGSDGKELEDRRLNGVLGKFGMRVKHTDGYVSGTSYFEYKKTDDDGEWCYRLPDHLHSVVSKFLDDDHSGVGRVQSSENDNDAENRP